MVDFSEFAFVEDNSSTDNNSSKNNRGHKLTEICLNKKSLEIGGLGEIYCSPGHEEGYLRLLIVGHNPSDISWARGHYYANPANRMWSMLRTAQIVPNYFSPVNDINCPVKCGVGFTDLMIGIPETKSCKFSPHDLSRWKSSLFERIESHINRVASNHNQPPSTCFPRIIAFAGVKQWKALFPANQKYHTSSQSSEKVERKLAGQKRPFVGMESTAVVESAKKRSANHFQYGIQILRPPGWPESLMSSIVFVLPSSSGAAALVRIIE
jgi:TDG/mug DNA glycosylase family protein